MIGVFDSGVGGLTILKSLLKHLPDYKYVYLGDMGRNPYGNHSESTIINYSKQAVNALFDKGAKLIIFACFSASSVALREIQKDFLVKPGIKDRKILGVLRPVVEETTKITKNKRIGVIGTRATINSDSFKKEFNKLDPEIKVISQACPLLVPLIEEQWEKKPETKKIVRTYLRKIKDSNIDTLVLGCTHYYLIFDIIKNIIGKKVQIPHKGDIVALSLIDYLKRHPEIEKLLKRGKQDVKFYNTENLDAFCRIGSRFLGKKIKKIKKIDLSSY